MMNLYLLQIKKPKNFDTVSGFVIRAQTENSARMQASANARDEGPLMWLEIDASTCEILSVEGPLEIILRDFHAG